MAKVVNKGFVSDFRQFFFRGLATLLPTVLTIIFLVQGYQFVQENISIHITRGICWTTVWVSNSFEFIDPYPAIVAEDIEIYRSEIDATLSKDVLEEKEKRRIARWVMASEWASGPKSFIGFGVAIVLVYIIGRLLASYIGKRTWTIFEATVAKIPGFKQVYPYIKQLTDFLFGANKGKIDFKQVVAVPYPRKGLWSIGLVTGGGFKKVAESTEAETISVFIPSSPMPVTGYVVTLPKSEVIDLPLTIEEALRFTVSGGVIVPDHQVIPGHEIKINLDSDGDTVVKVPAV